MIERTLNWQQLGLTRQEVFHELTGGNAMWQSGINTLQGDNAMLRSEDQTQQSDNAVLQEASVILDEVAAILHCRYAFVTTGTDTLQNFSPGRIILSQLRGSEALCYFVATAGREFEEYQRQLMTQGDMVRVYLANEIGSMIAERTADKMEELLQAQLSPKGLSRTNRFSPGYCGWHVREQPLLFGLFPPEPCGIQLTDSCLMLPIKSVSGVIGIGHQVKRLDYSCGICKLESCYKRRTHLPNTARP